MYQEEISHSWCFQIWRRKSANNEAVRCVHWSEIVSRRRENNTDNNNKTVNFTSNYKTIRKNNKTTTSRTIDNIRPNNNKQKRGRVAVKEPTYTIIAQGSKILADSDQIFNWNSTSSWNIGFCQESGKGWGNSDHTWKVSFTQNWDEKTRPNKPDTIMAVR